jgi:predicted metal-binding protein
LTAPFDDPPRMDAAPQLLSGAPASRSNATILVCVTCRSGEAEGERPGRLLYDALRERLASTDSRTIKLTPVECLSVCKRPCTVALAAPGKWTYVIGDLDAATQIDDIVEAASRFAATSDGIVPWRERPKSFRKGVISRTPPLPLPANGA